MRYSVIIPAAGSGSRMGVDTPKVLLKINRNGHGHSILQRTVEQFHLDARCDCVVVCFPEQLRARFDDELKDFSRVVLVPGGATRQESVMAGLVVLRELVPIEQRALSCVLVHDAARCCISTEVIDRVVSGVCDCGAVTAAVPVPDSLNRVSNGKIGEVVERSDVWAIQTPQGFWLEELWSAHCAAQRDRFVALDDASVVARSREVRVVLGDRLNIKVTHPHDLEVVERIG